VPNACVESCMMATNACGSNENSENNIYKIARDNTSIKMRERVKIGNIKETN